MQTEQKISVVEDDQTRELRKMLAEIEEKRRKEQDFRDPNILALCEHLERLGVGKRIVKKNKSNPDKEELIGVALLQVLNDDKDILQVVEDAENEKNIDDVELECTLVFTNGVVVTLQTITKSRGDKQEFIEQFYPKSEADLVIEDKEDTVSTMREIVDNFAVEGSKSAKCTFRSDQETDPTMIKTTMMEVFKRVNKGLDLLAERARASTSAPAVLAAFNQVNSPIPLVPVPSSPLTSV